MAFFDSTWYVNSVGHAAVTVRPQNTAVAAGVLRRQFTAPAVGNERVFVCIVAGTTANVTDATWVLTRGAKTTDGTATWQECTGASAVNGDATNTPVWTNATPYTLGAIIKRVNGASYWICSTAGTSGGSEPAWPSDTAGATRTDNTATWTCLGVVGNFTGGQAPHARLANACASSWFAAGNTVYVGGNHAESQATAITINPSVSQAFVNKIVCHDQSGSYPPTPSNLATTATISTTAAVAINFTPTIGTFYIYGLTFAVGVGAATGATMTLGGVSGNSFYYFESCVFKIATTSGSQYMDVGGVSVGNIIIWNNCQVSFAAVGQYIHVSQGSFVWQNTGQVLAAGSSVPTFLINSRVAGFANTIVLEALDLSQITAVFGVTFTGIGNWVVKDCKLHASATFATPIGTGQTIQYVRADGSATAYKSARYTYEGTETTETSITRVGGAVDPTGQAQSRKIVTTANAQWLRPFKAEPYAVWCPTVGSPVTVTVCGTINDAALPRNDDVWMEVEYLSSSSFPVGTIVHTTLTNLLSADAAVASDGSSWNGGGSGAGWSPFKLTTTITPQMAGYIHVRVRAAKLATTYYIDPQVVLS